MTRIYFAGELQPGREIALQEEQTRYVGRVLRLGVGDALVVFNGQNGEFDARISSIGKTAATLTIARHRQTNTESPLKVHLVQGVSRGERMDFVVQKATELGVKRVSPVLTEFGVVKYDTARAAKRRDHWQKVAISACEQSGRIRPPLIDAPLPLRAWIGNKSPDADLDLILKPGSGSALGTLAAPKTKVCLLVGPEGGFSPGEYESAALAGFTAISMGQRILRTETAALAAITIVQSLWGDLR